MTAEPHIDYESLAQVAMRSMVRMVLARVAKTGLPGEHHFYIAFDTQAPGVSLSKRLREKYPKEMTLVLQHRFWDLIVSDDRFEVKLTFDGIPERLVVPFASIRVFIDPSVRYGLQFDDGVGGEEGAQMPLQVMPAEAPYDQSGVQIETTRPGTKKARVQRKARADKDAPVPAPASASDRGAA